MQAQPTEAIYNAEASNWKRDQRVLLSDFTARPFVLEELGPIAGAHILDLGCGEGYLARRLAEAGAASVFGVDISSQMVYTARQAIPAETTCAMAFEVSDAACFSQFPRETFDRAMAVFLFNYLSRAAMTSVMGRVRSLLAPGGRFVFTVPHPCFPYMGPPVAPFFFATEGMNYFAGVDHTYEGKIWRRDGIPVPVRCVHKTFSDYFGALAASGFTLLPRIVELRVTEEHVALDPAFFEPLYGLPLHLLFRVEVE